MVIYAIQKTDSWFYTLGDGYVGLAVSHDISKKAGFLDLMVHNKMIKDRIFGVHTHMWNSTEEPSEIRFGGYNEELFKEGHSHQWMKTIHPNSWVVEFISAGFHTEIHRNATNALINPGYPFIAMP
jgi:hypothetical protein